MRLKYLPLGKKISDPFAASPISSNRRMAGEWIVLGS